MILENERYMYYKMHYTVLVLYYKYDLHVLLL